MNNKQSLKTLLIFAVVLVASIGIIIHGQEYRLENEVYLDILEKEGSGSEFDSIVLVSRASMCTTKKDVLENLPSEMKEDFMNKNTEDNAPIRLSALEGKYNVLTWDAAQDLKGVERVAIESKYLGKQAVFLSRVGFNKDRTKAVLCIESSHGKSLIIYELKDNSWKHAKTLIRWIS